MRRRGGDYRWGEGHPCNEESYIVKQTEDKIRTRGEERGGEGIIDGIKKTLAMRNTSILLNR